MQKPKINRIQNTPHKNNHYSQVVVFYSVHPSVRTKITQ